MLMKEREIPAIFYGWRVVAAAGLLAMFGWGLGFYGPPVYMYTVRESRGWSLGLVSTAVTVHFLVGACVIANLPALYRRFGVPTVTKAGALTLALGVVGWALALEPWQLFAATLLSGTGWVTMGAAAVNAVVSPWFVRARPAALALAYNGSSIGGVVFSPLWIAAISLMGFPLAAGLIGLVTVAVIWIIADKYFSKTPQHMGMTPDGDHPGTTVPSVTSPLARPLPGRQLWSNVQFITLAFGMSLGLFAQIGLIAHLVSLLVPALGEQWAGIAAGIATAAAIAGRVLVGYAMPADADRRLFACANALLQVLGSLVFLLANGENVPMLFTGVVLFGAGIGNTTSLPPLIAQFEFVKEDVTRVVPLIIAIGQASYAFAPAAFGLMHEFAERAGEISTGAAPYLFAAAAIIQTLAIMSFLAGRLR